MNDLQHYMTKCSEYRKRIQSLEQQLEHWKDQAMSELHDLNMCKQENERLRGALSKAESYLNRESPWLPNVKEALRVIRQALEVGG